MTLTGVIVLLFISLFSFRLALLIVLFSYGHYVWASGLFIVFLTWEFFGSNIRFG